MAPARGMGRKKYEDTYSYSSSTGSSPTYSSGGGSSSGSSGNNLTFTSERDPDISAAQKKADDYYASLDPNQQRIEAMARFRDLGIGMQREARASEARRGVSNTGVSSFNDRAIMGDISRGAASAGLDAARSGQQLQGSALGTIGSLATSQAGNRQQDLARLADNYRMQHDMEMDTWRRRMEEESLRLQQQAQQQNALINAMNLWNSMQTSW